MGRERKAGLAGPEPARATTKRVHDGVRPRRVNRGRYDAGYQVSTRSLVILAAKASVSRARVWYSA